MAAGYSLTRPMTRSSLHRKQHKHYAPANRVNFAKFIDFIKLVDYQKPSVEPRNPSPQEFAHQPFRQFPEA